MAGTFKIFSVERSKRFSMHNAATSCQAWRFCSPWSFRSRHSDSGLERLNANFACPRATGWRQNSMSDCRTLSSTGWPPGPDVDGLVIFHHLQLWSEIIDCTVRARLRFERDAWLDMNSCVEVEKNAAGRRTDDTNIDGFQVAVHPFSVMQNFDSL